MTQTSPPPKEPGAWPQHKLFWLLTAAITSWASSLDAARVEKFTKARDAAIQILLSLRDESFVPWHKLPPLEERLDFLQKALPSVYSKKGLANFTQVVKEWLNRLPRLPKYAHHEKWQAHLLTKPALTIWLDLKAALARERSQTSDTEHPRDHISLSIERFGLRSHLPPLNARITNNNPGGTHASSGNLKRPLPTSSSPSPRPSQVVKTKEHAKSAPLTEGSDSTSFDSTSSAPLQNAGHHRASQIAGQSDAKRADAKQAESSPRNDNTSPQGAEVRRPSCATNATTVPVKAQTVTSSDNESSSRDVRNPTVETIAGASRPQLSLYDFLNLQVASTTFRSQPVAGDFRHATILEVLKDQERKAMVASRAATTLAISPVHVVASIQPDSTLVVQTQLEVKASLDKAMLAGKRKIAGDLTQNLLSMVKWVLWRSCLRLVQLQWWNDVGTLCVYSDRCAPLSGAGGIAAGDKHCTSLRIQVQTISVSGAS